MKHILGVWMLLGIVCIAHAQTITVKDKESDSPIEMVIIMSNEPQEYASTNSKGQADLTAFKNSNRIEFFAFGYETMVLSYPELEELRFDLIMDQTNINLDEVVISANRWSQNSKKVPSKLINISAKEVAFQNPQTAADLLELSGKVFIQKSQQGGGSPMIRGFATNRLLYSIDGVRMNTAIFRGGNIQNVINMDPFTVENTEVLFGPGSVIYGSDAIGGVMSFQTLTPQFSLEDKPLIQGKALTRYSSANDEKTGHFDINIGWKKWALVTSFSSWDYDHLRQGSNGPDDYIKPYYVQRQDSMDVIIAQEDELLQIPSAYSQINFMQKVRYRPSQHWDILYGFHFSETTPYGRYDRHNRLSGGKARYAEWNYGPQKWLMNYLSATNYYVNPLYDQLTIRLAQQSFEESRIDRSLNSASRTIRVEEVDAYTLNADLLKRISQRNTLYYGVEYVLNDVQSSGIDENINTGISTEGSTRYPQSTWQSIAAYVSDEFTLNSQTTLQAGLRYNRFLIDATFDTSFYPFPFEKANLNNGALTGSIGTVVRPSESLVIRANLGTAFRSPNIDDIGKVFDSGDGLVTIPNPDLKAEYAYNVDLGIAKVFSDVVKVDITGYYTLLNNALVLRNFTLNEQDSIVYDGLMSKVQAIQNAAQASVYGVQLGLDVKLGGGFNFSTDYNFQYGEEELDNGSTSNLRHAAPSFGVSRLSYNYGKLKLQLYSNYQSERKHADLAQEEQGKDEIYAKDENGNAYSPAWYTLNLKGMYQINEALGITSGIENLTDQRYRPYSSGISGAGRNFIISLRVNF
ncbi:MAG: TonB-dependent receptor [Marinoscillum sp.]